MSYSEEGDRLKEITGMLSQGVLSAIGNGKSISIPTSNATYNDCSSVSPFIEKWKDVSASSKEIATDGKEGAVMEDNKLLEKYMDKIDRDQRELRNDVREREARIEKQISDSEARENDRMNRIEQLIVSQNEKIDSLNDKVREQLESDKKYRHTNNIAIVIGVVTTVIAMIGIYFATVSMITDIIGVAIK